MGHGLILLQSAMKMREDGGGLGVSRPFKVQEHGIHRRWSSYVWREISFEQFLRSSESTFLRILRVTPAFLLAFFLAACQEERLDQAELGDSTWRLKPGDSIQAAIDMAPEGAKFVLDAGVYRLQSFRPKSRQEFIGQSGTIISGAMLVGKWQHDQNMGLWVAGNLPEPMEPVGKCMKQKPLCAHREDLFINGARQERVASKQELAPGKWFYENRTAYVSVDPTNAEVEMSTVPVAISGDASDVILRNFTVEKYATRAQFGAVDARKGSSWQILDMTIQWNHGVGLFFGPKMRMVGGAVSNNGQLGIGGQADGGLVDGVEIAYNNYAGFHPVWEAGGTKFVRTDNLVVRNSCIHNNDGPGLWTDINNINIVFEGNKVFKNLNDGIKHEISYTAVIRNNLVAENGYGFDKWLWGSQILIQNSGNVEVYNNDVFVAPNGGHAISVIQQKRGEGNHGPFDSHNNNVYDNTVTFLGNRGATGIVVDYEEDVFWKVHKNKFDGNRYVGVDPNRSFWMLNERSRKLANVQQIGMEQRGNITAERAAPPKLSCR
jgi:hypothetical protein